MNCPLGKDCKIVKIEELQQSSDFQFFRRVHCETHKFEYNQTFRLAGYFIIDIFGHESRFIDATQVLPNK